MKLKIVTADSLIEQVMNEFSRHTKSYELMEAGRKWDAFRELYKECHEDIMNRGNYYGIDPYHFNWSEIFTPIESDAWYTIRSIGLPLYPQYPIGGVFVDFGDPVKKVALECDGKQFHNAEKDKTRDMYLNSLGWTVFRVTGKECHRPEPDKEDLYFKKLDGIITEEEYDQIMRDWAMNTSDGVISAIGSVYYGKRFSKEYPFEKSLAKHSYTYPV